LAISKFSLLGLGVSWVVILRPACIQDIQDVTVKVSQQDVVLTLHAQGNSVTEIHDHLVETIGGLAISNSAVCRSIRKLSWNPKDDEARDFGGQMPNQLIDARIAQILDDDPGASICEITHETGILSSILWSVRARQLGYAWRKRRIIRILSTFSNTNIESSRGRSF
jgi:hypothetical protein